MGGKSMDSMDNIVEKKEYVRPRNVNLAFRVTEEERAMIERRMAQTGMKNMRAYIVKMAVDGQVIHVELSSVKEMVRLLSNATNNINQIAKRANTDGSIYAADIDELRERYDEIWDQAKVILRKLAEM
jgi:transcriptional regulator of met regulon